MSIYVRSTGTIGALNYAAKQMLIEMRNMGYINLKLQKSILTDLKKARIC